MNYLASPYTDHDPALRQQRYEAACRATAKLLQASHVVFSPAVHGHPLVEHGLGTDWQTWERLDRALLERCDEVMVLMLDGWRASTSVRGKICLAESLGKPVHYVAASVLVGAETPTLAR